MKLNMATMLRRSLAYRRARSFSALIALTVSAGVATALLTLYADLDAKLHREFRSFGANIVLTAGTSGTLPQDALARAQQAAGADAILAPFAYAVATTDRNTPVVVAGTDFNALKKLDAAWSVDAWPDGLTNALIGQRAANFIANERDLKLTFSGNQQVFQGSGELRTGGDEDSRIYIPLATLTRWTGLTTSVIEIQVSGDSGRIDAALARLKAAFPTAQVQPVRQLVEGESRIVDRTHTLMYAAVLLIALTVGVSVLATLSASILERRRDFALMKALGGSHSQLIASFLLEATLIAFAGVLVGYLIGSALAWVISEVNFGTASLPRLTVLPMVLLLNMAIAFAAAFFPARVLHDLEPAALLKGE